MHERGLPPHSFTVLLERSERTRTAAVHPHGNHEWVSRAWHFLESGGVAHVCWITCNMCRYWFSPGRAARKRCLFFKLAQVSFPRHSHPVQRSFFCSQIPFAQHYGVSYKKVGHGDKEMLFPSSTLVAEAATVSCDMKMLRPRHAQTVEGIATRHVRRLLGTPKLKTVL